jgi:tetratricopeptide (TPR) repeat protein
MRFVRRFHLIVTVAFVAGLAGPRLSAVDASQRARTPPRRAPRAAPARPVSAQDPVSAVEARSAEAEAALSDGEVQLADSRYRDALMQGWLLLGALDASENRLLQARDAFRRASASAVDAEAAQRSLAMALLQTGEPAEALPLLSRLALASPADATLRRLLAQALVASGQPEQAVQELEEARGVLPNDLELAFALASGYLRLKKIDAAERLFARLVASRPLAQTYVLIGRTYRDFGEYQRARAALRTALKLDPRARRAHYYLGTIAIMEEGYVRVDEAAAEFRAELALAPEDPITHLRLGIVLEEAKQHAEALPSLELAARDGTAGVEAFEYLGRCQLALGRPADAVTTLQRALDAAAGTSLDASRIGRIHYQMATALRSLGRAEEAATHFATAERSSELRTDTTRERLARYLADAPEPQAATPAAKSPLAPGLGSAERAAIRKRLTSALARAYLNLGIVHARANRFARAAGFFEGAAAADPDFPQVQYSLGVAYFNAQQFDKATAPLERAAAADGPTKTEARRMLALSWLNLGAYDKAANLLEQDPLRAGDASLQYAYALALVRNGRAEQAQQIFSELLSTHPDSPELIVLLGQAHAQQGDYGSAIEALQRALALKPGVRDANAALGFIYFKQGRLDEAVAALRAELRAYPDEVSAMQTLATVLELKGEANEAQLLLRSALKVRPEFADARYLLGKILLAQGSTAEAVEHLEAAARLAPEDANVHFQLAQAYGKAGRSELAQQEFARYRELKDKKREGSR